MTISVRVFPEPWPWALDAPADDLRGLDLSRHSRRCYPPCSFVQIVTHLPLFSPFKCVIPCTTIVAVWLVTINVQLRISALSLSLPVFVSLSFCFAADCLCVCFLCFLHVSVCVVRLWSFLSVSGRRLSRGSLPRLPPLPRRRAAPPMPLCSPPVWLFTASSVSISTAAPPLTKAYSRRTGKGRCRAWVQWVRHNENEEPLQQPSRSLSPSHSGLSPPLCFFSLHPSSACFSFFLHTHLLNPN